MKAQTLCDLLPTELEISLMTEPVIMYLVKTHQNFETTKTGSKGRIVLPLFHLLITQGSQCRPSGNFFWSIVDHRKIFSFRHNEQKPEATLTCFSIQQINAY